MSERNFTTQSVHCEIHQPNSVEQPARSGKSIIKGFQFNLCGNQQQPSFNKQFLKRTFTSLSVIVNVEIWPFSVGWLKQHPSPHTKFAKHKRPFDGTQARMPLWITDVAQRERILGANYEIRNSSTRLYKVVV